MDTAVIAEVAFCWLVVVPLVVSSLVWLWRDANRHGQPGAVWAGVTLMLGYPFGLVAWLFLRLLLKSKADTANG